MSILQDIRNQTLAAEIETEVAEVANGSEFSGWSGDCRKNWARSILNIVEADGLTVKAACLAVLADVARGGI